jgi:XrtN system VIT domain protein
MPEGAVVTSLSLWINGNEEKAILTTKEKADSAYKTIVGAERRDPSVVHWQEGNSVSVRVFPVLPGESRKFKIGITAPLERVKGNCVMKTFFKGLNGIMPVKIF